MRKKKRDVKNRNIQNYVVLDKGRSMENLIFSMTNDVIFFEINLA